MILNVNDKVGNDFNWIMLEITFSDLGILMNFNSLVSH